MIMVARRCNIGAVFIAVFSDVSFCSAFQDYVFNAITQCRFFDDSCPECVARSRASESAVFVVWTHCNYYGEEAIGQSIFFISHWLLRHSWCWWWCQAVYNIRNTAFVRYRIPSMSFEYDPDWWLWLSDGVVWRNSPLYSTPYMTELHFSPWYMCK